MTEAAIAQFQVTRMILDIDLEGVTHDESLVAPGRRESCGGWPASTAQ